MEERAVRERWPLPEHVRIRILKRLCGLIDPETPEGATAEPRTIVAAARTLLAADKLNLEREKLDLARGDDGTQETTIIVRRVDRRIDPAASGPAEGPGGEA